MVFQGAGDGRLFAFPRPTANSCGSSTPRSKFETNNKVPAHGGAIATAGAVVVDGMVYLASGYAISSGASGGNVLLAFGVD